MQLNVKKTKELRISFLNDTPCIEQLAANNDRMEIVIETNKEHAKKTLKRKRFPANREELTSSKSKEGPSRNSVKSRNNEIWFDDVDPDDIENVTGTKHRKISEDDNIQKHTVLNKIKQTEVSKQEPRVTKHVAMDCEFVGIGKEGSEHMLARVSIVNIDCDVLYDKYVAAQERVVDYRTEVSGIRPFHLRNAPKFADVQKEVAKLIKDKILIGHSISTDLKVLLLDHPRKRIRDTSKYKPFQEKVKTKRPSLKKLAKEILSLSIQSGEHSSVEDACATMKLYQTHRKVWEKSITDKFSKKTAVKPDKNS